MASSGDRAVEGSAITLSIQSAKEKAELAMDAEEEDDGMAVPRTARARLERTANNFMVGDGGRWIVRW
jgi:hypothetical protein